MTWNDLNLLHHSPVLEDRVVCAIADAAVDGVYDVTLIEIVNDNFDWITEDQRQQFIREAARAAIKIVLAEVRAGTI